MVGNNGPRPQRGMEWAVASPAWVDIPPLTTHATWARRPARMTPPLIRPRRAPGRPLRVTPHFQQRSRRLHVRS